MCLGFQLKANVHRACGLAIDYLTKLSGLGYLGYSFLKYTQISETKKNINLTHQ